MSRIGRLAQSHHASNPYDAMFGIRTSGLLDFTKGGNWLRCPSAASTGPARCHTRYDGVITLMIPSSSAQR